MWRKETNSEMRKGFGIMAMMNKRQDGWLMGATRKHQRVAPPGLRAVLSFSSISTRRGATGGGRGGASQRKIHSSTRGRLREAEGERGTRCRPEDQTSHFYANVVVKAAKTVALMQHALQMRHAGSMTAGAKFKGHRSNQWE